MDFRSLPRFLKVHYQGMIKDHMDSLGFCGGEDGHTEVLFCSLRITVANQLECMQPIANHSFKGFLG